MELNEVSPVNERVTVDDLSKESVVRADVGEAIVNIREALVVGLDEENGKVTVIIGPRRMDGPYTIPIENVREILSA